VLGGDEFAVLLDDLTVSEDVAEGEDPSAGAWAQRRPASPAPTITTRGCDPERAAAPADSGRVDGAAARMPAAVAPARKVRRSIRACLTAAAASSSGAPVARASDDVPMARRNPDRKALWNPARMHPF
jgi:hypothetical protein